MSQNMGFFSELKDWSKRKLSIVSKYLDGFSKILGSSTNQPVYYVDGFAGRGTYDGGEIGSPVIAAELAEEYRDKGKEYRLYCVNVEKVPENYANLQIETARFGKLVTNYLGTFDDHLDKILTIVSGCPTLFFLDDFGVSGTKWDIVEKLIRRKGSTDIWIRFDHKTIRRLDGFFDSSAIGADQKFSHLPQLYGFNDSVYLHNRLDGPSPEIRIQNALLLYIERIEETYKQWKNKGFAAAYPVFSLGEQRKYHLVFGCAHQKAARLASDIVSGEDDIYNRELLDFRERGSKQPQLFPLDPTRDEIDADKVKRLKKVIQRQFGGKTLTRAELHYELLYLDNKYWFGRISEKHVNKAIQEMRSETPPMASYDGRISDDSTSITVIQ